MGAEMLAACSMAGWLVAGGPSEARLLELAPRSLATLRSLPSSGRASPFPPAYFSTAQTSTFVHARRGLLIARAAAKAKVTQLGHRAPPILSTGAGIRRRLLVFFPPLALRPSRL